MKTGKENFKFFSFDHDIAKAPLFVDYMARLTLLEPVYVLTRSGGHWEVRFPNTRYGLTAPCAANTLCYSTFMKSFEPISNKGKQKRRLRLTDWLRIVKDLQAVWGNFPLHVRIGYDSKGNYLTEPILDEDELIIKLKYMDHAC